MTPTTDRYHPDYTVAPGSVLAERLAAQGLSEAAHIWLGMESDYRIHRTHLADE